MSSTLSPTSPSEAASRVDLTTIFLRFLTIGAISFGGGLTAYLQDMLVEKTKWLTADEFIAILEIGQTVPGLNSVNMSVLAGSHLRGPAGAVAAALGMVLPGAAFVLGIGAAVIAADRP